MNEKILILDFGSQYTQLIARRVREIEVYCEILPFNKIPELTPNIKAVILSGSPFSVKEKNALHTNLNSLLGKVPVLGICYGAQYIADFCGGKVERSTKREYGKAELKVLNNEEHFFDEMLNSSQIWMSHGDSIVEVPENFEVIAQTESIPVAAFKSKDDVYEYPVYGIQFHPEVHHSVQGKQLLHNFIRKISGLEDIWTPALFVEETVESLKNQIGDEKVILGLSGGVDSSVAAFLLHRAIGKNLICLFLNNGLLRKDEFSEVLESYKDKGLNVKGIDATHEFLSELKGISDPELKRKTIGRVFIEVFERESKKIDNVKWLAQGTIYPDVIESVSVHGPSVTIKSHHNVGGLPDKLHLKIVEPLKMLFKDEVRKVGEEIGLSHELISRHPFPGPGLAIRILGEVSEEKVRLCQEADAIYVRNLRDSGWYDRVWQAGAILLPVQSVGVMGDERTYEFTVALRCVNSVDGMTAEWSPLPHELLAKISSEIINNVKGINRVVYDISTKPPATIEWE